MTPVTRIDTEPVADGETVEDAVRRIAQRNEARR
jgi:hypothetical protein